MEKRNRGPRFSLVLATVGRTEEPENLLASLRDQIYRNFELIVVDQNSDDRMAPILEPYGKSFAVRHVRTQSKGVSRARNLGLRNADGDLLAFPDDDCRYPRDLLYKVARTFAFDPDLDCVTGRSIDEEGNTSSGRFATVSGAVDKQNVWGRGISFTIFARARGVRDLRFDEELGAGADTAWGSGEETDYLLQILERGGKIYYDPALTVIHRSFVPPYNAETRRKAYAYGCGMGYLMKRYGYSQRAKAMRLARPFGGAILSAASFRTAKAGYHLNICRGRLKGLMTGETRSAAPIHLLGEEVGR